MSAKYLTTKIVDVRRTEIPRYGMTRAGYTKLSGAPTSYMIRLEGEARFRRVMCWCFSNSGTLFVRVKGECLITHAIDFPQPTQPSGV